MLASGLHVPCRYCSNCDRSNRCVPSLNSSAIRHLGRMSCNGLPMHVPEAENVHVWRQRSVHLLLRLCDAVSAGRRSACGPWSALCSKKRSGASEHVRRPDESKKNENNAGLSLRGGQRWAR